MHPHPENVDSQGVRIAGTKEIVDRKVANLHKIELFACINGIIWLALGVPFIVASLAFSCGIQLLENLRLFVIPGSLKCPAHLAIQPSPCNPTVRYGFGHDHNSNIYKVVRIVNYRGHMRESHKAAMLFMFTT